ncbi:MAG: hypothetical protein JXR95_07960 [Deltaproteobacteria bacterium]|nr:hypothetical protein [Deltaproteobacteria bacterium]
MSNNLILILDTQNRCKTLMESLISLNTSCEVINSSVGLAQKLNSDGSYAAVANIHHNDEFELLEHLSKISLTYPEIPLFILVPEPIENNLKWGPKVFILVKPVSAYSILRRLSFFNEDSFPYEGRVKGPMLLSLLDHCLFEQKSYKITINYKGIHKAEFIIREGKWVSLYLDDSLKNNKLLLPFFLDEVQYRIKKTDNAEMGEFEIDHGEYEKFRKDFHSWISLVEQMPLASDIVAIDHEKLSNLSGSIPQKVIPLIKAADGLRDMFTIFIESEQTPWDTAQNLGYLYFSDVLFVLNNDEKGEKRTYSSENSDSKKYRIRNEVFERFGGSGMVPKPRRSKELANWIMDPMAAARKLEEKLRDEIKKHRQLKPDANEFRPRRKTQPGLGELVSSLQQTDEDDEVEFSVSSDVGSGEWGNISGDKTSFNEIIGFMSQEETESSSEPTSEPDVSIPKKIREKGGHEKSGAFKISDLEEKTRITTQPLTSLSDSVEIDEDISMEIPAVVFDDEDVEIVMKDEHHQSMKSGVIEFGQSPESKVESTEIILERDPEGELTGVDTVSRDSDEIVDLNEMRKNRHVSPASSLDELKALRQRRRTDGYYNSNSVLEEDDDDEDIEEEPSQVIEEEKSEKFSDDTNGEYLVEPQINDDVFAEQTTEEIPELDDPESTLRISNVSGKLETFKKDSSDFKGSPKGKVITVFLVVGIITGILVWYKFFRENKEEMDYSGASTVKTTEKNSKNGMKKVVVMKKVSSPVIVKKTVMNTPPGMKPEKITVKKAEPGIEIEKVIAEYKKNKNLKELEKSLEKWPDSSKILEILGGVYYKKGNLKKAEQFAEKAVLKDSSNAGSWKIIGLIQYELGNRKKYMNAFTKYISLHPDDPEALKLAKQFGIKVKK